MKPAVRLAACLLLAAFAVAASTPCPAPSPGPAMAALGDARPEGEPVAARLEPACPCGCASVLPSALHALDPALRREVAVVFTDTSHPLASPRAVLAPDAPASVPDPVPIAV